MASAPGKTRHAKAMQAGLRASALRERTKLRKQHQRKQRHAQLKQRGLLVQWLVARNCSCHQIQEACMRMLCGSGGKRPAAAGELQVVADGVGEAA